MGVLDFLKGTKKAPKELEIPMAPVSTEELPELPEMAQRPQHKRMQVLSPVEKLERKAVSEEKMELAEREELQMSQPIFMHLNLFKDMLDETGLIAQILKENEDTLVRISEFKEDQDAEFKSWEAALNDIQKKLIYADKTLFGTSE